VRSMSWKYLSNSWKGAAFLSISELLSRQGIEIWNGIFACSGAINTTPNLVISGSQLPGTSSVPRGGLSTAQDRVADSLSIVGTSLFTPQSQISKRRL
jgi:hypothetical protein